MAGHEAWRLVVGIGNPGRKYAGTRHNLGFEAVEGAARLLGLELARPFGTFLKFGKARWASGRREGRSFLLLQPLTFVNLTGEVVRRAAARTGAPAGSFFVVCDDLNIPPGSLRIRRRGSDGGHKGLRSVSAALGSDDYPRMRLGIGAAGEDATGHVLGRFTPAERDLIDGLVGRAAGAIVDFVGGRPLDAMMNEYNSK